MVDPSPLEWRADLPAKDPVLVYFSLGVEAWVKIRRCFFDITDTNGQGQQAINRPPEIVNRNRVVQRDGSNLRESMDARIRAAGPFDMHHVALNGSNDGFEDTLNGEQMRLNLPPMEISAVIGDVKLEAAHGG